MFRIVDDSSSEETQSFLCTTHAAQSASMNPTWEEAITITVPLEEESGDQTVHGEYPSRPQFHRAAQGQKVAKHFKIMLTRIWLPTKNANAHVQSLTGILEDFA